MRHLLLLAALAAAAPPSASPPPCSLNGAPTAAGACACDAGWRGPTCAELAIQPGAAALGFHDESPGAGASWGANAVYADGAWHAFIAQMTLNCSLSQYGSNSQIIRATAPSPLGPFSFAEVVVAPYAHNPTVRALPSGGFALFMIGGSPAAQQDCRSGSGGRAVAAARRGGGGGGGGGGDPSGIAASWAPRITGPWSPPRRIEFSHYQNASLLDCSFTNPSPAILANGSVLLAFQGGYCHSVVPGVGEEDIGVAIAPSWNGTYALVTGAPIAIPPPWCIAGLGEDPFLYRSARGFHLLIHGMCYAIFNAIHAFSLDAVTWFLSPEAPYSYAVNYTDAASEVYWRVERPQLVFDPASGAPLGLFTGVCGDGIACLENPGKTWTLARPLQL
jgi:hypothetical protein